uniref:Uncharacterized protein n=1 Tax=Tetraselmis sp. GSL018 TaxID=582737 RepID=A0A061RVG4_9CHLO
MRFIMTPASTATYWILSKTCTLLGTIELLQAVNIEAAYFVRTFENTC